MLTAKRLTRPGLNATDLTVDAGQCVAVTGASGSGKSLLLRAIADPDPNEGDVTLADTARAAVPAPGWRRRVVYVPAESGWWADRVGDHFPDEDAAAGYLARVDLAEDALDWRVERLSTGERQRLALIRALSLAPSALLLDEPTSALDREATARVESLLHEHLATGAAMLMVTHDEAQARRLAHVAFRMDQGTLGTEPVWQRDAGDGA